MQKQTSKLHKKANLALKSNTVHKLKIGPVERKIKFWKKKTGWGGFFLLFWCHKTWKNMFSEKKTRFSDKLIIKYVQNELLYHNLLINDIKNDKKVILKLIRILTV